MTEIKTGTCHCGAIAFDVELDDGLQNIRRCNCSLCRRKGAVMASVAKDKLRVTRGADTLAVYQWNSRIAKHYFCPSCGIYTHHQRRSNPDEVGFNVACLDGVSPFDFDDVAVGDGASMSLVEE